jgi:hypothetical protein
MIPQNIQLTPNPHSTRKSKQNLFNNTNIRKFTHGKEKKKGTAQEKESS